MITGTSTKMDWFVISVKTFKSPD